jgi:hypothetical protein
MMNQLKLVRRDCFLVLFLFLSKSFLLIAQNNPVEKPESYKKIFEEIKHASTKAASLWPENIYAPLLFVNPETRTVIANEPGQDLKYQKGVYVGQLPKNINIANTAIKWNDKMWAMTMLPLPKSKFDRINLISHELFHRLQPTLGFTHNDPINNHLDKLDGRVFLTLEFEALKRALSASTKKEQNENIVNALHFRKHRRHLFAGSDSTENQIELNEGMAEYTGLMVANRPRDSVIRHFVTDINFFLDNSSFVRSFPYYTIPIYGYLLSRTNKNWNREINNKTDLTIYFQSKFKYQNLKEDINVIAEKYNYAQITAKEKVREDEINKKITYYKNLFTNAPCLKLVFEKMNVSFNPSNIVPLDSLGTVYPTIRVTDKWGILDVTEGALMAPNWKYIIVSNLINTTTQSITGKGWTLTLNENYKIVEQTDTGNYVVEKK